jgi:hypothetical protein
LGAYITDAFLSNIIAYGGRALILFSGGPQMWRYATGASEAEED